MSLVNPDDLRIATIECTACGIVVRNPTAVESYDFAGAHTHGHPVLQAWFDSRPDPRK